LFKISWGVRGQNKPGYEEMLQEEIYPRLEQLKKDTIEKGYFSPKILYGYFPVEASENELIMFDPAGGADSDKEIGRFQFARQVGGDNLCLSDYFAIGKTQDGRRDVAALHLVTIGPRATAICEQLNADGKYTDSYFLHGFAVETAEALAEWVHKRVRTELGMSEKQGQRYSPGYPAWPELDAQVTLFNVMDAERQIGVALTEAHQMVPEQSTSAMIVHHPRARYFAV